MKCGRGVTQGFLWIFESRWLAVAASERKKWIYTAQLGQPTLKNLGFPKENRHFWKTALLHPKMVGIVS